MELIFFSGLRTLRAGRRRSRLLLESGSNHGVHDNLCTNIYFGNIEIIRGINRNKRIRLFSTTVDAHKHTSTRINSHSSAPNTEGTPRELKFTAKRGKSTAIVTANADDVEILSQRVCSNSGRSSTHVNTNTAVKVVNVLDIATEDKYNNEDENNSNPKSHSNLTPRVHSQLDTNYSDNRNIYRTVGILTGSQFVGNLGFGCVLPVLPLFAAQMGLGASGVGLIISTSAIARLAMNIPFGTLSDAGYGRKPLMIAGNILIGAASFSTGLSHSLPALLGSRILLGIGSSCAMSGSGAYMGDLTKHRPDLRARLMGFQTTVVNSAYIVGPAIGGYLCDFYGVRTSFFIVGIAAGLTTLGYTFLPETAARTRLAPWERLFGHDGAKTLSPFNDFVDDKANKHATNLSPRDVYSRLIRNTDQQSILMMYFAVYSSYAAMMTIVPLHVFNIMGDEATAGKVGLLFASGAMMGWIGAPLGGYLADRYGRKKAMFPSALLISGGIFASTFGYVDSFQTLLPAIMLWGLGNSMTSPGMAAFAADIADNENVRGQALSLSRMAGDAAFLITPTCLGLLAQFTECSTALQLTSLVVLGANLTFAANATERTRNSKK